jgi:hypothetical protein
MQVGGGEPFGAFPRPVDANPCPGGPLEPLSVAHRAVDRTFVTAVVEDNSLIMRHSDTSRGLRPGRRSSFCSRNLLKAPSGLSHGPQ